MPRVTSALGASLVCCLLACGAACDGDDDAGSSPPDAGGGVVAEDASPPAALPSCRDEDAGDACADGYNCIDVRCVPNTCGDAVKAGAEGCDDGNVAAGDGCDPGCRPELESCGDAIVQEPEECDDGNVYDLDACSNACERVECGNARAEGLEECDDGDAIDDNACSDDCMENRCRNGRVDVGEECDDGNRTHDDLCSNACERVECGNGRTDPGEECDDDNAVDDDTCTGDCVANVCGNARLDVGEVCDGDTTTLACASDCKSTIAIEDDPCRMCEEQKCQDWNNQTGLDVLPGCIDAGTEGHDVRAFWGASVTPDEAAFVANCSAVIDCAHTTECWNDSRGAFVGCYCGSADDVACLATGPAQDAPCRAEWEAAAGTTSFAEVFGLYGDLTYATGWAYELLSCDFWECNAECSD